MTRSQRFAWLGLVALILPAALLAPERAAAAVAVQRVVSPGGIEAWLVEENSVPVIAVQFAFRGGSAVDPSDKDGLAEMAAGLLDEGAGDLDSQAFQRRLEDLSMSLSFRAGRDTFGGGIKEAVERIRGQMLAILARDAEDPETIAGKAFARAVFPEHPYGREPKGTPATIKAITAADLRSFAARHLARGNLMIGVAGDINAAELAPLLGDINAAELAPLLDATFGALPADPTVPPVAEVTAAAAGAVQVIDKEIPQSIMVFGHRGLKRSDPDFIPAYVLNHILGGGGFTSRLMHEVREKRGLAYSVNSFLQPLDHGALLIGSAATENARAGQSVELIRAEWRRLYEAGPSADELADAKTFLTGSFPLRFTTTGRIGRILVNLQLDDLGIDYLDKRNRLIEAVSLDDARRVAKRLLDPEALSFTIVGRPDGVSTTN
jgi:zinc protease